MCCSPNPTAAAADECAAAPLLLLLLLMSVLQPQAPAAFSTPALGLDLKIMNLTGQPMSEGEGELVLVPPSIGLSLTLLNRDHHTVRPSHCA